MVRSNVIRIRKKSNVSPVVYYDDPYLYCDHFVLDCSRKTIMRKLFYAVCNNPNQEINKKELVRLIYGSFAAKTKSKRIKNAANHNAVKLISRARFLVEGAFRVERYPEYEWFAYDETRCVWALVKKKYHFLEAELRHLKAS